MESGVSLSVKFFLPSNTNNCSVIPVGHLSMEQYFVLNGVLLIDHHQFSAVDQFDAPIEMVFYGSASDFSWRYVTYDARLNLFALMEQKEALRCPNRKFRIEDGLERKKTSNW